MLKIIIGALVILKDNQEEDLFSGKFSLKSMRVQCSKDWVHKAQNWQGAPRTLPDHFLSGPDLSGAATLLQCHLLRFGLTATCSDFVWPPQSPHADATIHSDIRNLFLCSQSTLKPFCWRFYGRDRQPLERVRRFSRSQLLLATVRRSRPMRAAGSVGQHIPWPTSLPAGPIGLERLTTASGSCNGPNLWTRQVNKLA
ncbi:hypothetical protein UY3_14894 [Chelonia mydas]|uniref:Uncharacterized protein n=1 Tax=Chelonia mydas TaxID=8469 RepID=M7B751_CHEMY|nr:hypothetical protein UY3_14894 [Chelonia mydas]